MAETTGRGVSRNVPARADQAEAQTRNTQLVSEQQGRTTIADTVVAKVAGIAAREVAGVHELVAPGAGGAIAGLTQRMTGSDMRAQGVNAEVGEREAAIDLAMSVDYGVSIPQVAEAVRRNIMNRVHSITGLTVKEVNIDVTDLYFPEDRAQAQQPERRVE